MSWCRWSTKVNCILDGPLDINRPKKYIQSFGMSTSQFRLALEWLESHHVTHVFMKSPEQYWLPVYRMFSEGSFRQLIANPQPIKNILGRKTDIKDTE